MAMQNMSAYQSYQKNKYETASPHRLTLMLYNGAIQFATRSQEAISLGNIGDSNLYIQKTQDIVFELLSSLNEREGGEIAANLRRIYLYINDLLLQANLKKDEQSIVEAISLLKELQSAWEQIGKEVTLG
ncbi:Flagellar protein FliS [compost metagenome]|uniref:Flagellar secretion chaperone FliS n=2 Tax=Fontibacillus TaxID=995014 RepID=A0A1G7PM66_9BACL|nr:MULTISPECIES: flagellar export chaperone FliS [Fontibacillus]MBA9085781.1 flagellar protein FliS [Fontibacillus solani]SDF86749.1 flagellar protein FliS [Fontibacillus panacisegetis]